MTNININNNKEEIIKEPKKRKNKGGMRRLIVIAIVVIGIGGGYTLLQGSRDWQAVLLVNGQAYFGKVRTFPLRDTIELRDVYYLQPNTAAQNDPNEPQLNLVKRGSEIHGPTDVMQIPKSQIVFWEKLRKDSQIIELIKSFGGGE